jgi:hypothetical protein
MQIGFRLFLPIRGPLAVFHVATASVEREGTMASLVV